jgi:hypothetical protein
MTQAAEYLLCKYKALSSTLPPSFTKKKERKKREREREKKKEL